MAKIVLDNIASGYNLSKINDNFDKIVAELQNKVLYRNNPAGEPNSLSTDLDANSRRILNLPVPVADSEPVTWGQAKEIPTQSATAVAAAEEAEAARDLALAYRDTAEGAKDVAVAKAEEATLAESIATPAAATAEQKASEASLDALIASNAATSATASEAIAVSSASSAQDDATSTATLLANAGSMLGINFGSFQINDGELIVTHLTTTTPSLVDGELILTYEALEI